MHALPWPSQSLVTLKKAPNVYPHTDTWTPILTPNLTQTKLLVRPISANKWLTLLCHLLKTTARLSPHDATHSDSGHIWPPPLPPAPRPSCHLLVMMTVEGLKGPLPLLLSAVYLDVSSMWLTLTLTSHLTVMYISEMPKMLQWLPISWRKNPGKTLLTLYPPPSLKII